MYVGCSQNAHSTQGVRPVTIAVASRCGLTGGQGTARGLQRADGMAALLLAVRIVARKIIAQEAHIGGHQWDYVGLSFWIAIQVDKSGR